MENSAGKEILDKPVESVGLKQDEKEKHLVEKQ